MPQISSLPGDFFSMKWPLNETSKQPWIGSAGLSSSLHWMKVLKSTTQGLLFVFSIWETPSGPTRLSLVIV